MRASMRAEGATFCLRHTSDPAGTEDLDGRESTAHRGDPHKDEVGVENHDCFGHQGGYENNFCRLGGPELLNDFKQPEWRKHVH